MQTKRTLLEHIFRYKQLILAITGVLVLFGVVALIQMPRDEFPEFTIRQGLIIGVYPGATSQQVEEQLTKRAENYLFQYEEVDKAKTYSVSKENVMVIYVEVHRREHNAKQFWAKLRHGLNDFKKELPSGVMSLTVNEDFGNTSALLLGIASDTKTYKELERYVERFENEARRIPSTSRVKRFGLQKEVINVYIDDSKLTNYGIKPLSVYLALNPDATVNYSGEIDDGEYIRPIHIPSAYHTENDIANKIVYADPLGHVIRVKDVARVVREYEEPDSFIRLNGTKCLIVSLEMLPGHNIVQYGEEVQRAVSKFIAEVPSDVRVGLISDMPHFVSKAIQNFLLEFLIAIFAVILVTVLLLPKRVALVAASAIPISILITIGALWATGISLQTVSLAGLIIVLGMVVDNAIVIVDNYVEKLDREISPRDAASTSVTDLFGSVFSATLIIVACFTPIAIFMTGMAGDFVRSLPYTVGFALFISLFVSAILIPMLSYTFIKVGVTNDASGKKGAVLRWLQSGYDRLLEAAFKRKRTVMVLGAASFVLGLILLAYSPQENFPDFERNQFAVEVYLPVGSSLSQTDEVMKEIEGLLLRDDRVQEVAAFVGTSSPRFNTLYAPNFPAKHYGQLLVITKSTEATKAILDQHSELQSEMDPRAHIKWKQLAMNPSKAPIELRISGDSISTLKIVSQQLSEILRKTDGARWVRTNYLEPYQSVRLNLDEDEAIRMGYTKQVLDYSLMVGTKGFPVATVWEEDYSVRVNLKIDEKFKTDVDEVLNLYVTSPFLMSAVQVRQLASAQAEWTEGEIVRRNGVRTLTVQADVERGRYSVDVFNKARPAVDKLSLPEGVSLSYGGDYEIGNEEMTPLYYALATSIVVIFFILLAQFRKIKTTILIMTTILLSIFGASFGVFVAGYPFSITAFVGVIGLIGIVIRNGIIYIAYAEELRREHGHSLGDAAIAAAKRRMRPIFLTSAAAAVGVIPMIAGRSPLWGPLGSVICFGLIFGMVLSLIVLPVLYYEFHRRDFDKFEEGELC
ncbi:MAG: efflux RND transporter permease subunit [Candidatus Zixiibacteriota bacterium]